MDQNKIARPHTHQPYRAVVTITTAHKVELVADAAGLSIGQQIDRMIANASLDGSMPRKLTIKFR